MKMKQGALLILLLSGAGGACAAGGGAGTMPWDAPIAALAGSLTGVWAVGVATVALAVAFSTLAFSNDLSGVGRTMVVLTITISALLLITNLLTAMFGGGAQVTQSIQTMQFLIIFATLGLSLVLASTEVVLYKLWRHHKSKAKQAQCTQAPLVA